MIYNYLLSIFFFHKCNFFFLFRLMLWIILEKHKALNRPYSDSATLSRSGISRSLFFYLLVFLKLSLAQTLFLCERVRKHCGSNHVLSIKSKSPNNNYIHIMHHIAFCNILHCNFMT